MISTWILIILTMLCGIGGAIFAIVACETKAGKLGIAVASITIAISLSGLLFWHLYYTESGKRAQKSFHSEVDGDSVIKSIKALKGYTKQGKDKGKWISTERSILGETLMSCNNCGVQWIETKNGMIVPMLKDFDYCPMCGADMRGGSA